MVGYFITTLTKNQFNNSSQVAEMINFFDEIEDNFDEEKEQLKLERMQEKQLKQQEAKEQAIRLFNREALEETEYRIAEIEQEIKETLIANKASVLCNKYYVYEWYHNGIPIYVGKGSGDRDLASHSPMLCEEIRRVSNDFTMKHLYEDLTSLNALSIESKIIELRKLQGIQLSNGKDVYAVETLKQVIERTGKGGLLRVKTI